MRRYAVALLLLVAGCARHHDVATPPRATTSVVPLVTSAPPATSPTPTVAAGSATAVRSQPATATPSPAPSPTSRPRAAGTVTLGESDSGRTVHVAAGTTIVVRLDGGQVAPWSVAESSNDGVVHRVSGTTGEGTSETTLRAVANGRATLSATAHPRCRDVKPPCGAPERSWSVSVVVA